MRYIVALFLTIGLQLCVAAQEPIKLTWRKGDVSQYAAKQVTNVEEILQNEATKKLETSKYIVQLNLTYTWTVTDVDQAGVASMQKTVTAMKSETTRTIPGKDGQAATTTDVVDSQLATDREKMPFLNKVAVTAKINSLGEVVEASSDFGKASVTRFKTELPFRLTLTNQPFSQALAWEREYQIILDPKYGGTGEQYPTLQKCTSKGMNGQYAIVSFETKLKNEPKSQAELRPLIPLLWKGNVFFDTKANRYHACQLTAAKELLNHEGDGTKFNYKSEYSESYQAK
jgi:hypothetical protein